jgi:hypothetical protein
MIIALNGKKGSGKDTVAKILIERYNFKRIAFADKLKLSAAALFNIHYESWNTWKNNENIKINITENDKVINQISVRSFLQRYGTEAHREVFGNDFWIDHALKGIHPFDENYVITDCRFENEIERIRNFDDSVIVRIVRNKLNFDDSHTSEAEPSPHLIDYYIDNDGTIEDLNLEVEELMEWAYQDNTFSDLVETYEFEN